MTKWSSQCRDNNANVGLHGEFKRPRQHKMVGKTSGLRRSYCRQDVGYGRHAYVILLIGPTSVKRRQTVGRANVGPTYSLRIPLLCLSLPERPKTALLLKAVTVTLSCEADGVIECDVQPTELCTAAGTLNAMMVRILLYITYLR